MTTSKERRRRTQRGVGVVYASAECDLGVVLVARSARGVRAIVLGDTREDAERELRERFPGARREYRDARLTAALAGAVRLVERPGGAFAHALDPDGTPFQLRVWRALREVPPGSTTTYAALARALGAPRAARAVGGACAANPLAVAVPCHRVVRGDGSLSGYRWGLRRKLELLRREAAPAEPFESEPAA
jgi:AraC family transcriptional regulator of adaptative response/methylated-DNA-[protein]-cysteine methyltransferase